MHDTTELLPRAHNDIVGLDAVLEGGWARNRLHLLEGSPGTGKTTIALQFLIAGARDGEVGIYVSLAETEQELREGARSHGWELSPLIEIFELVPPESVLDPDQQQSLLYSSDLELGETIKRILESIERVQPKRVVIDSLSEIRLLAQGSLRYRRQILALKHYFARHQSTVIMLDDLTTESTDRAVHSIAHSVVHLDQLAPIYGGERRRLRVVKCRGQSFRSGYHDFIIGAGGVQLVPHLVAAAYRRGFSGDIVHSGINALDGLLGGGIVAGSSTLIIGPAGTGKSLLILQYIAAAVRRGERAALFVFDEELGLLTARAKALDIDLDAMRAEQRLFLEQMDAAELFARRVCASRQGERRSAKLPRGRHRQSQWLSGGDAGGAVSHLASARALAISEPPRRRHVPDHRPTWHDGRHAPVRRCDLPRRLRHHAALFRGLRPSASRHLGREKAHRRA